MTIARATARQGRSSLFSAAAGSAWRGLRLVAWRFLGLFSGLVNVVCGTAIVISVLMAFFWEFSGAAPHFSFWRMIAFAGGCMALLCAYHGVLALVRPSRPD
jgi:hypothetical protein